MFCFLSKLVTQAEMSGEILLIRCRGKRKGCAEPKFSGAGTACFDPAVISGFSPIDVALCRCQSFHSVDWCIRRNRNARQNLGHAALIKAAYDALPENGALIAVENIIDDDRRENVFGLMMSLNMLIEFGDAFDFTGNDYRTWCEDAGFTKVEILPLAGPASAAIAYK